MKYSRTIYWQRYIHSLYIFGSLNAYQSVIEGYAQIDICAFLKFFPFTYDFDTDQRMSSNTD